MRRVVQSLNHWSHIIFFVAVLLSQWGGLAAFAAPPLPWSEFRGPNQNGHARQDSSIPLRWSESTQVTWKTALPHSGWSSPVIEKDVLWMTSATAEGNDFYVIGVHAATGKIVGEKHLFHCDDPEVLGNSVNGYASPTPAIANGRLYVHFGSYGTACIDTATQKVLWKREDLECRHYRGPGSSAMLFEDLLILTFDGVDQQYVIALDTATGDTVWRMDRTTKWNDLGEDGLPFKEGDLRKAFSTPVMAQVNGKPLILSVGGRSVFGYEPRTGKEIWSMATPGFTPSIRPVLHKDLALVSLGYGTHEFRAIRLDGTGDVSDSHVAWRFSMKQQKPDTSSPIVVDGLLYLLTDRGMLSCLDADTGEVIWSERIGGNYVASSIYAQGHIYFFSTQGKTTVIEPGRSFKVLATNELDAGLMASPAVFDNALFLRTKTHLYRIEE